MHVRAGTNKDGVSLERNTTLGGFLLVDRPGWLEAFRPELVLERVTTFP